MSNSSPLLVKILISLTVVPLILVRSLVPELYKHRLCLLGIQLEMVIPGPVLEFLGALTERRT